MTLPCPSDNEFGKYGVSNHHFRGVRKCNVTTQSVYFTGMDHETYFSTCYSLDEIGSLLERVSTGDKVK